MTKSRDAVRVEYLKHGTHNITDEPHFQSLLGMADEAADMLRHSIIQGRLNSNTGHYGKLVAIISADLRTTLHGIYLHIDDILVTQTTIFPFLSTEVKVNENHIAKHTGVLGQQPPLVQPITNEVVEEMENKPPTKVKIETTKASGH